MRGEAIPKGERKRDRQEDRGKMKKGEKALLLFCSHV